MVRHDAGNVKRERDPQPVFGGNGGATARVDAHASLTRSVAGGVNATRERSDLRDPVRRCQSIFGKTFQLTFITRTRSRAIAITCHGDTMPAIVDAVARWITIYG